MEGVFKWILHVRVEVKQSNDMKLYCKSEAPTADIIQQYIYSNIFGGFLESGDNYYSIATEMKIKINTHRKDVNFFFNQMLNL